MKLLGWMHRKLKQNTTGDTLKEFGIGNSCNCLTGQPSLDEQQYYQKYFYGPRPSKSQKENFLGKSVNGRSEGEDYYEEDYSDDAESGYLNGLLTIGTFGSDSGFLEPGTPTFPVTIENVTEKETSVTEDDLKLFNEELEKVLSADVKDDKWNDSSERTSHVSTITLSGTDGIGNGSGVCPLQGYLFGMPEPTTAAKKENRTSLGELFQKTKMEEEFGDQRKGEKESDKSLKKTLKKKLLGSSAADSVLAETKLNKIMQMFHRKVHPEGFGPTKKSSKPNKNDNKDKDNIPHDEGGYTNADRILPDEDTTTYHKISVSKERIRRFKSHCSPPHYAIERSDSNGNREYWIKTDADYLVLEL
ncbi:hypothetical protein ACHQM5_010473 [Ranunculus cassubicifolius]